MGAGILPITTHCGNVYVLLGQERYGNKWSDFGGSTNPGETFIKTTSRRRRRTKWNFRWRNTFSKHSKK